jgi:stress responsive alpha/beta barrel protein
MLRPASILTPTRQRLGVRQPSAAFDVRGLQPRQRAASLQDHVVSASFIGRLRALPTFSLRCGAGARRLAAMKILIGCFCFLFLVGFAQHAAGAEKLRHVVCFKFKSSATTDDIKKVEEAFRDLPKKISEVSSYQWGTNISKEQRSKGFTHCFVLTFKSEKDRDTYLEHPEHKAFGKLVGAVLDDVFVMDFWSKK